MKRFKEILTELNKSSVKRKDVQKELLKYKSELLNKTVKIKDIQKILDKIHDKLDLDIEIDLYKDAKLGKDVFTISGNYDPSNDEWDETAVFMNLIYSNDPVFIDEQTWKVFEKEYPASLEHEFLHAAQYRNRDFIDHKQSKEKDKYKKYLGNPDEIEAYANDIAHQLFDKFGSKAIKIITNFDKMRKASDRFDDYLKVYKSNDRVVKSLVQKVIKYLKEM